MIRQTVFWLLVMSSSLSQEVVASKNTIRLGTFEYFPGVGYYYVSENSYLNWTNAYSVCQNMNSDLAVINSVAEQRIIHTILNDTRLYKAFVGISDILSLGDHVTVTGEPLDRTGYKVWLGGSPGTDVTKRCVVYSTNSYGGHYKVNCNMGHHYICERPLWRNNGYVLVPGFGHYKLNTTGLLWQEAWTACRADGANLAVINSKEEFAVLQDIISKYAASNNSLFHIGVHAQYGMGSFVTVEGVLVKRSGFNQWEPGHPTFYGTYARLIRNATLDSTQYNSRQAFICEHALA